MSKNTRHAFTGKHYLSARGREELISLRIGKAPEVTEGPAPVEMLARVPSEECGCPEELWRIDSLELLFHFEADGDSDAFIFGGDFELETTLRARNLNDLRAKSFQWFADVIDPAQVSNTVSAVSEVTS
ncbi:hypothetical protein JI58_07840 [Marinosulfonomonas sp. PRT-SC04]|nr:hypothetical protein JI58_07840 [Marinosulfonomonas sp. PRT-SC04]